MNLVQIFQSVNAQTQWFIIAIVIFTIYFHVRFTAENAHKAPAFLTTVGILGTFIGIAYGLLQFNANDVEKSVPELIEGVKTGVWASAMGIFCGLTVKLRDIITSRKQITAKKSTGATVDDLATLLKSIQQSIIGVQHALAGPKETSLINQMKSARDENTQHFAQLNTSIGTFYENITQQSVKAIVEALGEIMRDFNTQLNVQIGDNFKELNKAAEKMIVWQENYSRQIGQVVDQQQIATSNMAVVSERYQTMVQHAESFNNVARSMSQLMGALETQRTQIDESVRSLAVLINSASAGLPQIERQIIEMTRQLTLGVAKGNEEFNAQIHKMIEKTKEQVTVLDNALSAELTRSLESFGRQLASLSQKFAEDYTPITERLNAILKIGK